MLTLLKYLTKVSVMTVDYQERGRYRAVAVKEHFMKAINYTIYICGWDDQANL